ncbi:MAG: imidazole glycerol phosphate synthase subunit HisH [Spirochaetes bacterium]|nr:imidazole glycerol phosphate synthase subunit HisH [Spirochaetota bacterium]
MIGIINYKAGNAPSVQNALQHLGVPCCFVSSPDDLRTADGIILPGVGSAEATMRSLRELSLIDALNEQVRVRHVPFLGICVGLQILFEHSEEGDTDCLGWLKGGVLKFSDPSLRVPHIGWNEVTFSTASPLTASFPGHPYFYFVNSYYAVPEDNAVLLGRADYGAPFCAAVQEDNIYATQFHAEKSGQVGLMLLSNFAALCG